MKKILNVVEPTVFATKWIRLAIYAWQLIQHNILSNLKTKLCSSTSIAVIVTFQNT